MHALASRLSGATASVGTSITSRCPVSALPRVLGRRASGCRELVVERTAWSSSKQAWNRSSRLTARATAEAVVVDAEEQGVSDAADSIIRYAINLARASETYEVHSWMLLLGILKFESSAAAQILKKLGVDDLYGAWHEVLWALHVCDGLKPRSYTTDIKFADRAFKVVTGASDFATWHGKDKMYSEDLLMALAAGSVLDGLFPDLNLSFDRVRKAVEKHTGRRYQLPDEEPQAERGPLKSEDDVSFL